MLPRCSLFLILLALLPHPLLADPPVPGVSPAERALQLGQDAMEKDRFAEAVDHFQHSLKLDMTFVQAHLSLAAAHLALGKDSDAVVSLAAYLQAKPDHFLIRMPYAEVLTRLKRYPEAQTQLESFILAIQDHPRFADEHLIAAHTRLMEVAVQQGDDYSEHLHRGIGLFLLAGKRLELGGARSAQLGEELLCKAAGELTLAQMQQPSEARPAWYLYSVWRQLGQGWPAERSLRAATRHAGLSYLTPSEARHLFLTTSLRQLEPMRR